MSSWSIVEIGMLDLIWYRFEYTDESVGFKQFSDRQTAAQWAHNEGDHLLDWFAVPEDEVFDE